MVVDCYEVPPEVRNYEMLIKGIVSIEIQSDLVKVEDLLRQISEHELAEEVAELRARIARATNPLMGKPARE
jgi:hypothetical protein